MYEPETRREWFIDISVQQQPEDLCDSSQSLSVGWYLLADLFARHVQHVGLGRLSISVLFLACFDEGGWSEHSGGQQDSRPG